MRVQGRFRPALIALLAVLARPVGAVDIRINLGDWTAPIGSLGSGTGNARMVVVAGSARSPDTGGDAAVLVQKHDAGRVAPGVESAMQVSTILYGTAYGTHATALHAIANHVGGVIGGSPGAGPEPWLEALRGDAILIGPGMGSAYGLVTTAGTSPAGNPYQHLIGVESTPQNLTGDISPAFQGSHFVAGYVSTCGYPGTGAHGCDVALVLNPYGAAPTMYGVMAPAGTLDKRGDFLRTDGASRAALDAADATLTWAAVQAPNDAPYRQRAAPGLPGAARTTAAVARGGTLIPLDAASPVWALGSAVWATGSAAGALPHGDAIAAMTATSITLGVPLRAALPTGSEIRAAAGADLSLANLDATNTARFAPDAAIAAVAIGNGRSPIVLNGVPAPAFGTPAHSSAACTRGQIMFDASYLYTCVAANTWRRTASSGF